MDGRRFDAMVRAIAKARSRRGLAGLAAGGALAAAFGGEAQADLPFCLADGVRCGPTSTTCEACCTNCNVKRRKNGRRRFVCGPQAHPCRHDHDCCAGFTCESAVCTPIPSSDRALKTGVAAVDPGVILDRMANLPIAAWSYAFDDPAVRHIGPMAHDFAAAFGLGADDRAIHPIDGQGVAFAAIQALHRMATALHAENAALHARLDALERRGAGD